MQIRLYATLADLAKTRVVEVADRPGMTVGEALRALGDSQPALGGLLWDADGALSGAVRVVFRGQWVQALQGLDTPVGAGEVLHVFPPVGGG